MKLDNLQATIALDTLIQIAAFRDRFANDYLDRKGSYALFDEPGAVRAAREALKKIGYDHVYE